MHTVELVYFNAGGGHRAAAQALAAVAAQQQRPWRVRLTNLFEVLDPQQRFRRFTGMAPEAYYNARLARGWTLGLAQELKLLQASLRLLHPTLVQRLQRHWAAGEPDLVVSLVPNFNRALGESLASTLPGVPFVTVLTDLADHPPSFWIEPAVEQQLVCGTDRAVAQALAMGCAPQRVHRVSGMILRPEFHAAPATERARERERRGLPPHALTGVVMFGGHGSSEMLDIAERLADVPLVLMCGHNARLAAKLRALPARAPHVVVGFTSEVVAWLRLADFFVGKPGPGSLSEALHCGLPVVTTRNRSTMPQERYNTEWVREQGVGLVLKSFAELPEAIGTLRARLPALRERVARLDNRAVFEVTALIARLLDAPPAGDVSRNCLESFTQAS
ncbi:MAG: galactosyldiacylglycerol synthase [Rubrivivax sp.]|nr:galactosyldiacylglycerol synthase [Rubrivivax sp.]